jgi:ribosomal protein S12 methylthiotransferase accessory factor YcaO
MINRHKDGSIADPLLNAIDPWIKVERIGEHDAAIYIAHARLIVTLPTFKGDETTIAVSGAGAALESSAAKIKCSYELIEQLVGTAPATRLSQVHELRDQKLPAVPWETLTPYSDAELHRIRSSSTTNRRHWCRGQGIHTGRDYEVPASKVLPGWNRYISGPDDGECDASGIAAGHASEAERCSCHGLCEILERDAMMLAWRSPRWPVEDLGDAAEADPKLAEFLRAQGLTGHLYEIGDPMLAPVILCVLSDPGGGVTCGSSCSLDLHRAASKSVLEAAMLWNSVRAENRAPVGRTYEGRIRGSRDHILYGWQHGSVVVHWFSALPRRHQVAPPNTFEILIERCVERFFGAEPILVDLNPCNDQSSHYVCRIVQPHACRKEWNDERPFIGGRRFRSLTSQSAHINPLPHPYG